MTVDAHGITLTTSATGETGTFGMRFTTNTACTLTTVTKESSCTATRAVLKNSSHTVLDTASFSGDDATFNYALSDSTEYSISADSNGSSYTRRYHNSSPGYPISGTNVDWVGNINNDTDLTGDAHNIESITTTTVTNATVNPTALALTLSLKAPDVQFDFLKEVTALNLSLTEGTPESVVYNIPNALGLSLSVNAPSYVLDKTVSALNLTLDGQTHDKIVSPTITGLNLTLTVEEPNIHLIAPLGVITEGTGTIGTRIVDKEYLTEKDKISKRKRIKDYLLETNLRHQWGSDWSP